MTDGRNAANTNAAVSSDAEADTLNTNTNNNGTDVESIADRSAGAAWGVLISMVVGLAAASAGGYLGAREPIEPALISAEAR